MKEKISFLIGSLVFYNLFFIFCFYFKIVSFLYVNFSNFNILVNILFTNILILLFDIVFMLIYNKLKLYKLSYFFMCLIGVAFGVVFNFFILKNSYGFSDYLAVISFFVINTIFISYSLYFEKEKGKVFG